MLCYFGCLSDKASFWTGFILFMKFYRLNYKIYIIDSRPENNGKLQSRVEWSGGDARGTLMKMLRAREKEAARSGGRLVTGIVVKQKTVRGPLTKRSSTRDAVDHQSIVQK